MDDAAWERFRAKYVEDPETGCWLWTACIWQGYGIFRFNGRVCRVHRLSYEHFIGPIPEGLELDHLCRVMHCLNPAHLEAVTHRENVLRGNTLAAANVKKTHCKYGHEFNAVNTYTNKGKRFCRICGRKASREYLLRKNG